MVSHVTSHSEVQEFLATLGIGYMYMSTNGTVYALHHTVGIGMHVGANSFRPLGSSPPIIEAPGLPSY